MKKFTFFIFILSVFFTAQAGYVERGIFADVDPSCLKNYTLTFDARNEPIAAASVYYPTVGGYDCNSIAIVRANSPLAVIFPISLGNEMYKEDFHIEVRDFHYDAANGKYVLCGARGVGSPRGSHAFIATINTSLLPLIEFTEYLDADVFYSIWGNFDNHPYPSALDYYACGKKKDLGVIASVNPTTLQITRLLYTEEPWEYHKIIGKWTGETDPGNLTLIVSGRNPECKLMGFTMLNPQLIVQGCYHWEQLTDPASLCVVSNDVDENNFNIILASSYSNTVTLYYSNLFPLTPVTVTAYPFNRGIREYYLVQDIATNREDGISVVGYMRGAFHSAWYGHLSTLAGPMDNYIYNRPNLKNSEHHKVEYLGNIAFTGGYFDDERSMGVLFATPLYSDDDCHYIFSLRSIEEKVVYERCRLREIDPQRSELYRFEFIKYELPYFYKCSIFNIENEDGGAKSSIFDEKESEITTFYDHIIIRDTPNNINYVIYSVTGQLVQTGTTNPDISTAQLSKGMYILRLENGKAFKFVK